MSRKKLRRRPSMKNSPERTCVGCRQTGQQADFERFVLDSARRVSLDVSRKLPGRGAWLHLNAACFELAERRKGWQRAFQPPVLVPDVFFEQCRQICEKEILAIAQRQRQTGDLVLGIDPVKSQIADLDAVICSATCRTGVIEFLRQSALPVVQIQLSEHQIGECIGLLKPVHVLGLSRLSSRYRERLTRFIGAADMKSRKSSKSI